LNEFEVFVGSQVRGSLKEHVLEQVGETGPAHFLVGGSHVVPEVHGHDRSGLILGQGYEQPVIETKGFYRNSHCRKLPAMQSHWNPLSVHM
jgi:hypothetical protein